VSRRAGSYEIVREIGRGGMAVVHLARQSRLERLVALKEMRAAGGERLLRESRLAGSLSHPNIVTVHDYFEHEGTPFIAMEYLERGSLRPSVGRLAPPQVAGVLDGILAALAAAEQHRIVHRDLKPENVMVTRDGRVKIADFGIARALDWAYADEAPGTAIGTPGYMAPEQAQGRPAGPWSDLYSAGAMAFELLAGRLPAAGCSPRAALLEHDVDAGLSDLVACLLEPDPAARPSSAQLAGEELEELALAAFGPRWRRRAALAQPDRTRSRALLPTLALIAAHP
jgi:serine/threonine protein kinase